MGDYDRELEEKSLRVAGLLDGKAQC